MPPWGPQMCQHISAGEGLPDEGSPQPPAGREAAFASLILCPCREVPPQEAGGACPDSPRDAGAGRGPGLCRGEIEFGGSGKKRGRVRSCLAHPLQPLPTLRLAPMPW